MIGKTISDLERAAIVAEARDEMDRGAGRWQAFAIVAARRNTTREAIGGVVQRWEARNNTKMTPPAPLQDSRYPIWNEPIVVSGNRLLLGDPHFPYHNAKIINYSIARAIEAGIDGVVIGGDLCDQRALSHWPEDIAPQRSTIDTETYRKLRATADALPDCAERAEMIEILEASTADPNDLPAEWAEARALIRTLAENFKTVEIIMGNHDAWLIRRLQKAIIGGDYKTLLMGDNQKIKFSEYYWMNLVSGGKPWRISHPNGSGKGVSHRKGALKFRTNFVMFHNHHFSISSDASGEFIGIEPGMTCDEQRMAYATQRDNFADEHATGSLLIRNGYPTPINKYFCDWEHL